MQKRVFIIHGWEGYPEEGWFLWLKTELEKRDFIATVPQMPDADHPRIEKWVSKIAEVVGEPDDQTYFVGHSMGCQAIVRYLETLSPEVKVGGAVFVAGFFKRLTEIDDDPASQETEKHWLQSPLDWEKVVSHIEKSVAIFSDNDPFVPMDNQDDFVQHLNSEVIVEHGKGHFSGPTDKVTELPVALEALLTIAE